jgi:hypothetical protein
MKRVLFIVLGIGIPLLLAAVVGLASRSPLAGESTIFIATDIITMAAERPSADAIYVRSGVIAGLGSLDDIRALAGTDADEIDLGTAALLPGLIEVHTHPTASALLGTAIDVSGFTHDSRAEIMATLRDAADSFSPTPWLIAFGWDPVMVADLEPPTLAELDRIAPDQPMVVLTQMMHDAYANSAALAAANIDRTTENPTGAEFVRDADGQLTGTVREVAAIARLLEAMPAAPIGAADLLLSLQYAKYARAGYTTLAVLGTASNEKRPIEMIAKLSQDERVPVRTVVYGLPHQLDEGGWQPGSVNARFHLRGVKFWMDGSPFAGGAAWAEPYENTPLTLERLHLAPNHAPKLNYSEAEFEKEFERFHKAGFQVAVHVQGERAIDRVLDVTERVQARTPRPDARHRLEHNALITRPQLQRALALGVTPSFFIDHIRFYGHRLPEIVGEARTTRYMPIGTAIALGHRATLHSDNPATPIAPLRVLQTAVARSPRANADVIAPDERLSIEQALGAMTINAAWQLGMEDRIGSLEVGKSADFTVLDRNPLEVETGALTEIKVLGTWIDGQPVDTRSWRRANVALAWRALRHVLADATD